MEEKLSLSNVREIIFPVQDIEKTAKFYTNVFDLKTIIIEENGIITNIYLFTDFQRFRLRLDKIEQKPIFQRELSFCGKVDLRINCGDFLSRGFNSRIIENIPKNNGRIISLRRELVFEDIDGRIIEIIGRP